MLSFPYKLHIKVQLERTLPSQAAKAIGMLCREHVKRRQIQCTVECLNEEPASRQAARVLKHLLDLPSPWRLLADAEDIKSKMVLLDDRKVGRLAKQWENLEMVDSVIIVPHYFYLPLMTCFIHKLEIQDPDILNRLCIFFSYPEHAQAVEPDIIGRSYLGERIEVLKYIRRVGLKFFDLGHQVYIENIISLASYMIPAKQMIFMDDDFFIRCPAVLEEVVEPLRQGYSLSGMYYPERKKIHTSFFALNPEYLRQDLGLFDDGENLYFETLQDTGSITFQELSKRTKGVFTLEESTDGSGRLGRHLGHCGGELWFDFPVILKQIYQVARIPVQSFPGPLRMSALLEALAFLHKTPIKSDGYTSVDPAVRLRAVQDFSTYFSALYNNHCWLEQQAKSPKTRLY